MDNNQNNTTQDAQFNNQDQTNNNQYQEHNFRNKRLYKTAYNKMIFGVCNGLAEYFNMDVSLIRVLMVVAGIFLNVPLVIAYIVVAIILPTKKY